MARRISQADAFPRLPAFTPIRMEQPLSRAAAITSATRLASPMLPGLMRRHAAPATRAFDPALIVEMDVRHDRHRDSRARSTFSALRGCLVRDRDAHDVRARLCRRLYLSDRSRHVRGQRCSSSSERKSERHHRQGRCQPLSGEMCGDKYCARDESDSATWGAPWRVRTLPNGPRMSAQCDRFTRQAQVSWAFSAAAAARASAYCFRALSASRSATA